VRVVTAEDAFELLTALPRCAGLTPAEIDHCEASTGLHFAADFRRLLRITGNSLGWLFPDGLDDAAAIGQFRQQALEMFAENGWTLGPSDVVLEFLGQGCEVIVLRPVSDQSRVLRYFGPEPEDTGLSLGLYLATALERHLRHAAERKVGADPRLESR
jgi:hypothetical protein